MEFGSRTLMVRCTGDDVRSCQADLKKLGYDLPESETERAFYGQGTRNSVYDFQQKHNISASGLVNKETADKLTSETS